MMMMIIMMMIMMIMTLTTTTTCKLQVTFLNETLIWFHVFLFNVPIEYFSKLSIWSIHGTLIGISTLNQNEYVIPHFQEQ